MRGMWYVLFLMSTYSIAQVFGPENVTQIGKDIMIWLDFDAMVCADFRSWRPEAECPNLRPLK